MILAGGLSSRFGRDKALMDFGGKPLIAHIVGKLRGLGDEWIVSIGKSHAAEDYRRVLPKDTLIVEDTVDFQGPLAGFMTALNECKCNLCFLAACDMPFIEPNVVEYLFSESSTYAGAVPRWRDGKLEPLHAVYDCNAAKLASRQVVDEQVLSMISLVDHIPRIRFVNVEEEIAPLNPTLETFRNLNTPRDLDQAQGNLRAQN
jgi:molybdopterin-guanine dinucleotide biosynthesis protein A